MPCYLRHLFAVGILAMQVAWLSAAAPAAREWTPERMMQLAQIGDVQVSPGRQARRLYRAPRRHGRQQERIPHAYSYRQRRRQRHRAAHPGRPVVRPAALVAGRQDDRLPVRARRQAKHLAASHGSGGEARPLTRQQERRHQPEVVPGRQRDRFHRAGRADAGRRKGRQSKNDARVVDEDIKMSRLYVVAVDKPGVGKVLDQRRVQRQRESGAGGKRLRLVARQQDHRLLPHAHAAARTTGRPPTCRWSKWPAARSSRWCRPEGGRVFAALFAGRPMDRLRGQRQPADLGRRRHDPPHPGDRRLAAQLAETFDRFGRYSELVGWSADGKRSSSRRRAAPS